MRKVPLGIQVWKPNNLGKSFLYFVFYTALRLLLQKTCSSCSGASMYTIVKVHIYSGQLFQKK